MSGFYWDSANPTPVIEFSVSSSTVTVSTSGVCKVLFPKQGTNGLMQELDLSGRSYSCNFATYPDSALCGITEANWGSAMPWFVYLVNTNNTAAGVYACITRNPKMSVTPAAAEINDTNAVSASQVQTTINSFTTHDNSTAAVPCICIGSLTMTYATATKKWTPGTLAVTDGFGKFQEGVQFTMPLGQNGAATGSYLNSDGGQVPTWAGTITYVYRINRNGAASIDYSTFSAGNCSIAGGAGADPVNLYLPYATTADSGSTTITMVAKATINGSAALAYITTGNSLAYGPLAYGTGLAALTEDKFVNSADDLAFKFSYQAF